MKTFGRYLLALVFLGAMAGSSYAFDVPVLRGRVNDYANLLTPDQRATLEATLRGLEEKTSAQVAILTVTSLQGLDVGGFSMKVVEAWKLGQKGKDNGLLIMYSTAALRSSFVADAIPPLGGIRALPLMTEASSAKTSQSPPAANSATEQ